MDREEAATVAESILGRLRTERYQALVDRLVDEVETEEVVAASGTTYQVEMQAFWDSGRPPNLMVMVAADDGSFRGSFSPVTRSFIMASDGSFVGE